jgi:hypothetical protein
MRTRAPPSARRCVRQFPPGACLQLPGGVSQCMALRETLAVLGMSSVKSLGLQIMP